jgi:inner membrane transporter RhtA
MSVHPVLAAVVGLLVLGQHLLAHEWIGIAVVVLTNAAAVAGTAGVPDSPARVGGVPNGSRPGTMTVPDPGEEGLCTCATAATATASSPSSSTG